MGKTTNQLITLGLLAGITVLVQRQQTAKRQAWHAVVQQNGPGWALITGASSGIGAAFARRLAREGYSLVLVARRAERLRDVADSILAEAERAGQAVAVEVLPADLDQPADLERVEQRLGRSPAVTLLVNNAGFGGAGPFASGDLQKAQSMIRVHLQASVRLARAALPGMLARRHGAVINVSSLAGFIPMPGSIPYASTKAFLNNFSEGLSLELAGSGVRVQALCPGMTRSEFHSASRVDVSALPGLFWMSSEEVVEESLRGLREDRVIVVPGRINQIIHAFAANAFMSPLIRLGLRFWRRLVRRPAGFPPAQPGPDAAGGQTLPSEEPAGNQRMPD